VETAIQVLGSSVTQALRGIRRSNCKQIWRRVYDPSECISTFMACPRAFGQTKNAQDRQLQRQLSNARFTRSGTSTAMENCLYIKNTNETASIVVVFEARE
jgi:hypothetical protein